MRMMFVLCLCLAVFSPIGAEAACVPQSAGVLTSALAWTNTDTTDTVTVWRATMAGGPYTKVGSVPAGTLVYTDSTVLNGISYYYVVQNVSTAAGPSSFSNEACKTFFSIPPAPTSLSVQ